VTELAGSYRGREPRGAGRLAGHRGAAGVGGGGGVMASWRPWSNEPEPVSTIDDDTWRGLQVRAARANPQRADVTSAESIEATRAAAHQYKNRRMS
jgi:hypothetical protein